MEDDDEVKEAMALSMALLLLASPAAPVADAVATAPSSEAADIGEEQDALGMEGG